MDTIINNTECIIKDTIIGTQYFNIMIILQHQVKEEDGLTKI